MLALQPPLAIAVHRAERGSSFERTTCHGHGHCPRCDMKFGPPKLRPPFRRDARRGVTAPDVASADVVAPAQPPREPENDIRRAELPEPSWRGSSFDLKHGLDVVELPTSLPVDVLDRLFNARGK